MARCEICRTESEDPRAIQRGTAQRRYTDSALCEECATALDAGSEMLDLMVEADSFKDRQWW